MAIKIIKKAIDKHTHCTIFGFVYDDRVIKQEWIKGSKKDVKRTFKRKNKK